MATQLNPKITNWNQLEQIQSQLNLSQLNLKQEILKLIITEKSHLNSIQSNYTRLNPYQPNNYNETH